MVGLSQADPWTFAASLLSVAAQHRCSSALCAPISAKPVWGQLPVGQLPTEWPAGYDVNSSRLLRIYRREPTYSTRKASLSRRAARYNPFAW